MNSEEEKQYKNFEKIRKKGKYAECRIMIDADNPEKTICGITAKKVGIKEIYCLLLAVRNVEKQILGQHPVLNLIDALKLYDVETKPITNKEESISTPLVQLMREIGKKMKGEENE